jgi:hypothetical protein
MRGLPEPLSVGLYRWPSVYEFVKLMRSPASRIVAVCKPRYKTCLLGVGPCEGALAGYLEPHTHAHVYRRDIRNFVVTHPWATILHRPMYRDAWREEGEWAENSSCKPELEIGQKLPCGTHC